MKVSWKIALYNVVFHQLPLIQHCSIFYKKKCLSEYQIFRRIQWQNMLRMHLLQSRISNISGGDPRLPEREKKPLGLSPTCGCGARFVPLALNSPLLYKLRLLLQLFLRTLIIRSECIHYACILLCKQTFQIRSVLVQSST